MYYCILLYIEGYISIISHVDVFMTSMISLQIQFFLRRLPGAEGHSYQKNTKV
jgi:hypothetical protein